MKLKTQKIIQSVVLAAALTSPLIATSAPAAKAQKTQTDKPASTAAGLYAIDSMHSKIGFEIPHLVISTVDGQFTKYEGTLNLNENFNKSEVDLSIDISSIDTSVKDRDDHLKSADFFDAQKYPKMTFKSKKVTGTEKKFKLIGDLTIKNVTKQVELEGTYLGAVKDVYGQNKVAYKLEGEINRQQFGLTWNKMIEAGPAVGDNVKLIIKVQATKK